jgi:cation-transporting ATPase E
MKKRRWTIWLVPFLMASAALIGILLYRRRRAYRRWRVPRPDLVEIQGLSEAEAAARQTEDPVQERRRAMRQVRRGIWRDNILSIFVLDMVGLTVANWLLGAPLSALMSFGILCLNVGINVGQELLAVRWIERVLERARPLATVIRDGQVKSIIQDKVVVGDALVIGPGDQILADGQVRSSTDLLTSKSALARGWATRCRLGATA